MPTRPTARSSRSCPRAWPTAASISSAPGSTGPLARMGESPASLRAGLRSGQARPRASTASTTASTARAISSRSASPTQRVLDRARLARRLLRARLLAGRVGTWARRSSASSTASSPGPLRACSRATSCPTATGTGSRGRPPAGPCKRLHLFLRWMVRREPPDFGLWTRRAPRRAADPGGHAHREHGALDRPHAPAKPELEDGRGDHGTAPRRSIPADPVKYDFALCHKRMSGQCLNRRDARVCAPCGLRPVCRHWRGRRRMEAPA